MVKEIFIQIGEEECTVELLTEQAPRTCEIIEQALPITGLATHAKLVDQSIMITHKSQVPGKPSAGRW